MPVLIEQPILSKEIMSAMRLKLESESLIQHFKEIRILKVLDWLAW